MSSRVFEARTSHTSVNPQICGLTEATGCSATTEDGVEVEGAILKGDMCFYLTCLGDQASPASQIQRSNKKDDYSTGYRVIPSGRTRTVGKPPFTREQIIFKWQEQGPDERWHDVEVWEKMVHHGCAERLGYQTPQRKTMAHKGDRTEGMNHRVKPKPISGLEELAVVAYEEDKKTA